MIDKSTHPLASGVAGEVPIACTNCEHQTLAHARTGDELEIIEVGNEHARVQALRFGMAEGACVTCVTRIPAGPLVVRSGRQEIAIGRHLASQIRVRGRSAHGA